MAKPVQKQKADKDLCRMVTPPFRVSFPHVFKPNSMQGSKPKYSVTALIAKDPEGKNLIGTTLPDENGVTKPRSLKEVIKNAKLAAFGSKENWPEDLASPVNDGDKPKYADKEGYKGHYAIKFSSNEENRPEVVGPDMEPMTEHSDFYPGCYARAVVYAYVWEFAGKRGVGFILDSVQKVRDGKSFGGKKPAKQVFSPIEAALKDDDDSASDGTDDDSEDF